MRTTGAFFRRGLGRDQRKVGVHLARVGIDHFPVQLAGQGQGRGGFTRTRGTGQTDDRRGKGRRGFPGHYETRNPPCGAARQGVAPAHFAVGVFFQQLAAHVFGHQAFDVRAVAGPAALTMVELMNSH